MKLTKLLLLLFIFISTHSNFVECHSDDDVNSSQQDNATTSTTTSPNESKVSVEWIVFLVLILIILIIIAVVYSLYKSNKRRGVMGIANRIFPDVAPTEEDEALTGGRKTIIDIDK